MKELVNMPDRSEATSTCVVLAAAKLYFRGRVILGEESVVSVQTYHRIGLSHEIVKDEPFMKITSETGYHVHFLSYKVNW